MATRTSKKSVSPWIIALGWIFVLLVIFFWVGFWIWTEARKEPSAPASGLVYAMVRFVVGGVSLIAGVASYFLVLYTNCFVSNFSRPVWNELKVRIYFANVFVPLLVMMGIGFMLSAFLTPVLTRLGMSQSVAQFLPVLGCIGIFQVVLIWLLVWSPLEKRIIRLRLAARGITEPQLDSGIYLGLSDPNKSTLKKFSPVEEDIGMLWFDPEQMIYWGDNDGFTLRCENLMDVERKMDAASTSALSGTAHVILHVRQDDGSERSIRLHCEGVWTLGGKRSAMNELAERIETWRVRTAPPPVPQG